MSNETRRILLVEDEKAIRDAVTAYLEMCIRDSFSTASSPLSSCFIALVTATAPPPTAARAPTPMAPYRKWRRVRRISPPLGLGMRTPEGALPRKEGAGALSRRPALRRAGATWRLDGAGRCEEGVQIGRAHV